MSHLSQTAQDGSCEAILQHACDTDYGDVWQCDLHIPHPGRHHATGGSVAGGDGFDADCVEIWWHGESEPH